MKIYLASPYGFSECGRYYLKFLKSKLIQNSIELIDPWTNILEKRTEDIQHEINNLTKEQIIEIGKRNIESIKNADIVIAVLDGTDVDSGVAAEIGYAYGLNKKILGYRGDFRLASDNKYSKINLQVETFIRESGGSIYTSVDELVSAINKNLGNS